MKHLVKLFEQSLINNWEIKALADYQGDSFTYNEVATEICRIHALFDSCGVKKGDKVAIIGKNAAHWGITYIATITYGATIVPLLPDFPVDSMHHLVNHSDSVALFVSGSIYEKLTISEMPVLRTVVKIEDYSILETAEDKLAKKIKTGLDAFDKKHPNGVSKEEVKFDIVDKEEVAVISYTSGTTGVSKGVMVPHRSLLDNIKYGQRNMPLDAGDAIVSFLPSAHMYGCVFEFLFPFTIGCTITFLTRTPSPAVVLKAFGEIKPALILSVPLVIEKIYKKKIKPTLQKPVVKIMTKIPGLKRIIYNKVKKSVYESFGGNFRELVIGGAAFNPEAEQFFKKIKLPFTVGYGMTECGPLMAYSSWKTTKLGASGKPVDALEVKIDSSDQQNEIGEIICRGSHVMSGYYKNEEETAKIIDPDGWMHSGDLGTMDKEGNIFIKGRKKTMLLNAAGKNIYPDEIESIINNMWLVLESVVVMRNNLLIALVVPDKDVMKSEGKTEDDLLDVFKGYLVELNKKLPKYMQVSDFEIRMEEFEKTPKRSIKRFLYS